MKISSIPTSDLLRLSAHEFALALQFQKTIADYELALVSIDKIGYTDDDTVRFMVYGVNVEIPTELIKAQIVATLEENKKSLAALGIELK